MTILLFLFSALFLTTGHLVKIFRWELFIQIYEKPNRKNLFVAFLSGTVLNMLLPYKLGEIVRVLVSGRRMKNGTGFSLATVIVDRYLDVIIVAFFFFLISLSHLSSGIVSSLVLYSFLSIGLLVLTVIAFNCKNSLKRVVKKTVAIFNPKIELSILFFLWSFITSFKNIKQKINTFKLLMLTFFSWLSYLVSYLLLTWLLGYKQINILFRDVISILFSAKSYNLTAFFVFIKNDVDIFKIPAFYSFAISGISIMCLFLFSLVIKNVKTREKYDILLPFINEKDRNNFFELYFNSGAYKGGGGDLGAFITINDDIYIIQDMSAGSNAKTLLCTDESKIFYRKYIFGNDVKKLKDQIDWIEKYSKNISVTRIISKKIHHANLYCSYDMEYNPTAFCFFYYIHSEPLEKSTTLLYSMLDDISRSIHSLKKEKSTLAEIGKYCREKVSKNLEIIGSAKELKSIIAYENLVINGKVYKNLVGLTKYLSVEYLTEIFKDDFISVIHGDLTVENIICMKNSEKDAYYLIDPNTGNIHESPFLDFSKLLQSLHGNYEFFMKLTEIDVSENRINFNCLHTYQYKNLLDNYILYLKNHFSFAEQRSIFFHEIVHWLRLLPYKISISHKKAVIFFTAFIVVINDVIEQYGAPVNAK